MGKGLPTAQWHSLSSVEISGGQEPIFLTNWFRRERISRLAASPGSWGMEREARTMTAPETDVVKPEELVERALAVIRSDRLPYLATVEGDQPRLRPITPVKSEGFTVYIANLRSHGKTSEIASNPRVELCYLDGHHDQVRITGTAEVVTDPAVKQEIWASHALLRKHVGDRDNQDFILYRVIPTRVRFMKEWVLTYREVPFQRSSERADSC